MKRLKTTSVWMNKLWKYDMILGGEFFDDDGNLISITTTDIAQILSDLNFLYQTFPTEFEMMSYTTMGNVESTPI